MGQEKESTPLALTVGLSVGTCDRCRAGRQGGREYQTHVTKPRHARGLDCTCVAVYVAVRPWKPGILHPVQLTAAPPPPRLRPAHVHDCGTLGCSQASIASTGPGDAVFSST